MKYIGFIIFFSIVLSIYSLLNWYLLRNMLPLAEGSPVMRRVMIWTVIGLASAFLIGRFTERIGVNPVSSTLIWIGSFWLAIMVYAVLFIALTDLVRGVNHFAHFIPACCYEDPLRTRKIVALIIGTMTLLIVGIGHLNTWFPVVRKLDLTVDKQAGSLKTLRIAAFSDVHLGTLIEKNHLRTIVNRVNNLHADVILIPGDIIDEDIAPVIETNVGDLLLQLKAKYGVFAVTGNHEFIGGIGKATEYLQHHGIQLLNDTAVRIGDEFYLIGREDLAKNQMTGQQRLPLQTILHEVDTALPLILLDHQPVKLQQAIDQGVDLQLSGHTHHGQLWPFNYITRAIFTISRGYRQIGKTHFVVSSGVGGWGPPVRTNARPEIWDITLHFNEPRHTATHP